MRAVVYTESNFYELGIKVKDAFLRCLTPDENGSYDSVIVVTKEVKDKVNLLTDEDFGMSWNKDFSYIEKFKDGICSIPNGRKILMTNQWSGQKKLIEVVTKLNSGMNIKEVNDWLKEDFEKNL